MVMRPVSSSNLASVGYENQVLRIAFRSGAIYEYTGVPKSVYLGLLSSPSLGKYFHANIKNVFPCRRVG